MTRRWGVDENLVHSPHLVKINQLAHAAGAFARSRRNSGSCEIWWNESLCAVSAANNGVHCVRAGRGFNPKIIILSWLPCGAMLVHVIVSKRKPATKLRFGFLAAFWLGQPERLFHIQCRPPIWITIVLQQTQSLYPTFQRNSLSVLMFLKISKIACRNMAVCTHL